MSERHTSTQNAHSQRTLPHTGTINWDQLHGRLPIPMTNDYLFRALLQRNNNVLKSLTCSLLHLDENTVRKVVILNPIVLGEHVEDKDFILDIRVLLDNRMAVNLDYSDFRFIPIFTDIPTLHPCFIY